MNNGRVLHYLDERAVAILSVADRNVTSDSKHQIPEHERDALAGHWSKTARCHQNELVYLFYSCLLLLLNQSDPPTLTTTHPDMHPFSVGGRQQALDSEASDSTNTCIYNLQQSTGSSKIILLGFYFYFIFLIY